MNADTGYSPSWEEFKAAVADATGFLPDELTRERRFIEDLDFDSLQLAEVLVLLIDDYGLDNLLGELEDRPWKDVTLGQLFDEVAMRTGGG
jgi:acyl carrier protein